MAGHWLAQLNVAALRAPLDAPELAGFVGQLDAVNALADAAPGFVWRLVGPGPHPLGHFEGHEAIVNLSVWRSAEALQAFTYGNRQAPSRHRAVMGRRREWFHRLAGPHQVLWWVPEGHLPGVAEAMERLETLRRRGPSAEAFNFRAQFPAPDTGPRPLGTLPPAPPFNFRAQFPAPDTLAGATPVPGK